MSAGKAKCCGSGQFLKAAFNCGYMIRCLLFDDNCDEGAKDLVVDTVEGYLGGPVSALRVTRLEQDSELSLSHAGRQWLLGTKDCRYGWQMCRATLLTATSLLTASISCADTDV